MASLTNTEKTNVNTMCPVANSVGLGSRLANVEQMKTNADKGTANAVAGAATLNTVAGTILANLGTLAGADFTLTLTNSTVLATSIVLVSAGNGTNTTVGLAIDGVTPANGSVVISVRNTHATAALNGTITINYLVIN